MVTKHDKRDRAGLLRQRLAKAMMLAETNQSALARDAGVDRSTISQLLAADGVRMPNAQVIAECATALGVSTDWLLGLSDRPEMAADLLAASLSMTKAPRALVDEQIFKWHQEAAGYKIRHVPAGLPDMLKTQALLEWEYTPHLGRTAEQAIGASNDRLDWMRASGSDYEIAMPVYEVASFVRAEGYYTGLPAAIRREQIDRILALHDQLYPRLRVHLFDARRLFSAPVTVFGPLLAVVYVGLHYLAFRDTERVHAFTDHFDGLVREAYVSSREWPGHLQQLSKDI